MTLFRKRMGFVPEGPPLIDDVPERVRTGLVHLVDDRVSAGGGNVWITHSGPHSLGLRASRRRAAEQGSWRQQVEQLFGHCTWLEFYEIVEELAAHFREWDRAYGYGGARAFLDFRAGLNRLFADENIGYRMDGEGNVQLNASPEMVEASAAALGATQQGAYAVSAEQFRRALEKLTFRKLDPTNAVKDAVGALEGVLNTRFGRKGDVGDFSAELRQLLHPTLAGAVSALVKVEAFRGDMAAHADKPTRSVSVEEAVFVVHVCAAAIALLASSDKA